MKTPRISITLTSDIEKRLEALQVHQHERKSNLIVKAIKLYFFMYQQQCRGYEIFMIGKDDTKLLVKVL